MIIPHINFVQPNIVLGTCSEFFVEKIDPVYWASIAKTKIAQNYQNLMFFVGTPEILGVTILLHGDNEEELKKVEICLKKILQKAREIKLESDFLKSLHVLKEEKQDLEQSEIERNLFLSYK